MIKEKKKVADIHYHNCSINIYIKNKFVEKQKEKSKEKNEKVETPYDFMEKQVFNKKMAKQIAKYRVEQNLTQGQLGKLCGNKPKQIIQRLESGAVTPSVHFVYHIAKALNVSLNDLINFKEPDTN
jgi:DNA-binding XRE family transcriptional regulator